MQRASAIIKVSAGIALVIFRIILYATNYPLHSSTDIIILNITSLVVGIGLIAVGSSSLFYADQREAFDAKTLGLGAYNLDEAAEGNRVARAFASRNAKIVCGGLALALFTGVTALEIRSSETENEKRQALEQDKLRPILERQERIEKMKANLKSDDYSVRREALVELLKDARKDFRFVPYSETEEILRTDPHAIDALISILGSDKDNSLRRDAATALGMIYDSPFPPKPSKNPRAVDALITTLKEDPDRGVRVSAAEALEMIHDPRGLDAAGPILGELYLERKRTSEKEERRKPFICKCIDRDTGRVLFEKKVSSKEECDRFCPRSPGDRR